MKKIFSIIVILFLTSGITLAQSRREWLEFGDVAYNKGDYKLALACYQNVVKLAPGSDRDLVTPYECRPYTPPKKTIDSASVSKALTDSS